MFSIFYIYIKIYPFKFLWFLTWDRRKIIVQTDAQDIPDGDEDIRKRDVPRECRKKKAPSGGLGEMIVGSIVYVFIFVVLGQS